MNELKRMFERQSAWQRSRSNLPWAEKLRLSVVMRESLLALRQSHSNRREDSGGANAAKRKEGNIS